MDAETKQFFNHLVNSDQENKRCIDCGTAHPQWASVSYGTYFCLNCSGIHRSLGVHLSFVRSISMDTWNAKQKAMMELGGNANFKKFALEQGIDGFRIQDKYNTVAAEYYRNMLKAKYDGTDLPALPPNGTGKNLNNGMTVKRPMGGMGSTPPPSNNMKENNDSNSYGLSYHNSSSNPYPRRDASNNDLFAEWGAKASGFLASAQVAASQFADTASAQLEEAKTKAQDDGWFDFDNLQQQATKWKSDLQNQLGGNTPPPTLSRDFPPIQHQSSNVSSATPPPSTNISRNTSVSTTPPKAKPIVFREKSPERVGKNLNLATPDLSKSVSAASSEKKVDVWDTDAWFDDM